MEKDYSGEVKLIAEKLSDRIHDAYMDFLVYGKCRIDISDLLSDRNVARTIAM